MTAPTHLNYGMIIALAGCVSVWGAVAWWLI